MSPDLTVLVPTRSRPHTVAAMAAAFADTVTAQTWIAWCIDGCPRYAEYRAAINAALSVYPRMVVVSHQTRRGLVATLNHYGTSVAASATTAAIGYFGDDHRPLTPGWDGAYLAALAQLRTGIVYGDDQVQGANLPTQMAMTVDIPAALGYLAPPTLYHMYCDTYWKDLGEGAGCLRYLPEVTVAHRHPSTGLTPWDDSYHDTNSAGSYATDKAAYQQFRVEGLAADVAKVAALRGGLR